MKQAQAAMEDKMFQLEEEDEPQKPAQSAPDQNDIRHMDDKTFLQKSKRELESLEQIRFAKKLVYEFRKKITYPALLVLVPITAYLDWLLLLWTRSGSDGDGAFGITFALLGGAYWWVTGPKREYRKEYKERMLPKIAELFGNFVYDLRGKVSMGKMQPSKIVPRHTRYKSEDYFRGSYKGVEIEFCEMHLTEQRGSGKKRRTVTTFKGLAILLGMKSKRFYGHTILDKDRSGVSEWFKQKSTNMKRAKMADPKFEKMFDAYTTDQVEARYLIDPLMIEDLKDLHDQYTGIKREHDSDLHDKSLIERIGSLVNFRQNLGSVGKGLTAAWYDNKMLILISSSHNHFEPADLHIPATDPRSLLNMKAEIGDILTIIDRLDLYDPRAARENAQTNL